MKKPDIDLDMLAVDIADTIDRYGYDLDVDAGDVRGALPAFLAALENKKDNR